MNTKRITTISLILATFSIGSIVCAEDPALVTQSGQNLMIGKNSSSIASRTDINGLIVLGDTNVIEKLKSNYKYKDSMVLGKENKISSTNNGNLLDLLIAGHQNEVAFDAPSASVGTMIMLGSKNEAIASKNNNEDGIQKSVLVGIKNKSRGAMAIALGNNNQVSKFGVGLGNNSQAGYASIALGYYAKATSAPGFENSISSQDDAGSITIGNHGEVSGNQSIGLGNKVSITKESNQSIAIGLNATVQIDSSPISTSDTKGHTVVIGEAAVSHNSYALVLGYNAKNSADNAVVIGREARNSLPDSVILGSQSSSTWDENKPSYFGWNFNENTAYTDADQASYARSIRGFVSVGNEEKKIYRRITNVAAGLKDTDVVNVGQLKDALKDMTLPTNIITENQLTQRLDNTLKNYVKKAELPASPDLSNYVKKTELPSPPDLSNYATKEDLQHISTTPDLESFAKKTDLNSLATKAEIKDMATQADIKDMATKDDIKDMATKDDIKDMATKDDVKKSIDTLHENITVEQEIKIDKLQTGLSNASINSLRTETAIASLHEDISHLRSDMNVGVANAAALAALHVQPMDIDSRAQLMIGMGFHGGKQSLAFGAGYRLNSNVIMNAGVAIGTGGKYTENLGISWRIGRGVSTMPTNTVQQLQAEVEDLKNTVRIQAEQIKELMKHVKKS